MGNKNKPELFNLDEHINQINKRGFNEEKTMENLSIGYKFKLTRNISAPGIKEDSFLVGDTITILDPKKSTQFKTKDHEVIFTVTRDGEKKEHKLGKYMFIHYFLTEIDIEKVVALTKKEIEKIHKNK